MSNQMITRRMAIILLAGMVLVLLSGGIALYPSCQARRSVAPLSYQNIPFPVLNSPVRAGEQLRIEVNRCNRAESPVSYTFTRSLVRVSDGAIFPLEGSGSTIDRGCATVTSLIHTVPVNTEPGEYYIKGVASVPTKWKTHLVPWRTEMFVVKAP